jgi:hypothetical protein
VTNNLNEKAGVYQNNSRQLLKHNFVKIKFKGEGGNTFGVGAKVILKTKDGQQLQQMMPTRGFMSSVEPTLLFGIGDLQQVDEMLVIWENEKMQIVKNPKINTTLTMEQKNANVNVKDYQFSAPVKPLFEEVTAGISFPYQHQENVYFDFNRELLIPFKVSIEGPTMAVGDVNGDGLEDFFVGSAKGDTAKLFCQQSNGSFHQVPQKAFIADYYFEDTGATLLDADGDADCDDDVDDDDDDDGDADGEADGEADDYASDLFIVIVLAVLLVMLMFLGLVG